jgi:hypothetical protein
MPNNRVRVDWGGSWLGKGCVVKSVRKSELRQMPSLKLPLLTLELLEQQCSPGFVGPMSVDLEVLQQNLRRVSAAPISFGWHTSRTNPSAVTVQNSTC